MDNNLSMRAPRAKVGLRAMSAADVPAMHRLIVQMSWPHRPEDCLLLLELGSGVVAVDADKQVVGVGMWWGFGLDTGTIGMVLVAPEHQGQGVGRALMNALIAEAGPRALMLNATAEGLALYEKLGFRRIGMVHQHQSRRAEAPCGPAVPAVPVREATSQDDKALCALDAAAFGAERTGLIFRLLSAGRAWVVGGALGRPGGFAVLREFGRGQIIGPVIASNEDDAIALVASAAAAARPGVLRIDIPAHAQRLGAWLTAAGLPAISAVTTMRCDEWPTPQGDLQRFALALQALG